MKKYIWVFIAQSLTGDTAFNRGLPSIRIGYKLE